MLQYNIPIVSIANTLFSISDTEVLKYFLLKYFFIFGIRD